MDLTYLIPKVLAILTAPAVDLSTISAKRVRKQLIADGQSEDFLRQNKEQVDALIAQVYEGVSNASNLNGNAYVAAGNGHAGSSSAPQPQPTKRKRTPTPPPSSSYVFESSQPQPLKNLNGNVNGNGTGVTAARNVLKSDAELARQLSYELNGGLGRNTRGGGGSVNGGSRNTTPKTKSKKQKGSAKKSKATIDSDEDDDVDGDGSGGSRPKKKSKGGFQKEFVLSDALAGMVGETKLSRPQAVKKLWEHIRGNNLQDPKDKREILCDDAMKAVFRTDRLNMFKMNKLLGDHLFEPEEQVKV